MNRNNIQFKNNKQEIFNPFVIFHKDFHFILNNLVIDWLFIENS